MTVHEAVEAAAGSILRRDAETLLQHVTGQDRAALLAHPERLLTEPEGKRFHMLAARRAAHEPLQYLTEQQEFYGMPLRVTPAVLIPRPETELLVEAVLGWARARGGAGGDGLRLLDVGTGSGAIVLALAKELPKADLCAVDLSVAALAIAEGNAQQLGLSGRVQFLRSDLLAGVPENFDGIVSNPPYVPRGDAGDMQPEVRDHEPHLALFAGEDGLEVYRRLIPQAQGALLPDGLLAMEFGFGQRDALRQLLAGWREVQFRDDYAGIPRVVTALRQG